jgi:hypothetical protein
MALACVMPGDTWSANVHRLEVEGAACGKGGEQDWEKVILTWQRDGRLLVRQQTYSSGGISLPEQGGGAWRIGNRLLLWHGREAPHGGRETDGAPPVPTPACLVPMAITWHIGELPHRVYHVSFVEWTRAPYLALVGILLALPSAAYEIRRRRREQATDAARSSDRGTDGSSAAQRGGWRSPLVGAGQSLAGHALAWGWFGVFLPGLTRSSQRQDPLDLVVWIGLPVVLLFVTAFFARSRVTRALVAGEILLAGLLAASLTPRF